MFLLRLPYELMVYIVTDLNLDDIGNLAYTCRASFQLLLENEELAKWLFQTKAPYCLEARDAGTSKNYASGFRRLLKRREALLSVSPYLVAIVGFADKWIYENGVLCYYRERELRILDLYRSADSEIVVDLQALLDTSTPHKYKLTLLYYSHNIVSCLYSRNPRDRFNRKHFLLALNALRGEVVTVLELESDSKLFVRNNDHFLYYGTTTEPDQEGDEYWVIKGFDIAARAWIRGRLDVPYAIGTDVGSTVCFEIIDGYFYGLSNLRSLAVEEVDWVSYYSCFRFPLSKDGFSSVQHLDRTRALWRRDHTKGPLEDRWTFLRLLKDEAIGRLKIVESRMEWSKTSIISRHTYYTSVIEFDAWVGTGSDNPTTASPQGVTPRTWPRDPHMVHPGDDTSTLDVTLTKCPLRSYYPDCQAFIDLVDDSSSFDSRDQKLRIRGGSRRPWTPGELAQLGDRASTEGAQGHDTLLQQIYSIYRSDSGLFWPPKQDPSIDDPALADLYAILNPPGYTGNTHGSWDERSMVYVTGGMDGGLRAMVFVSWDPAIRLAGIAPFPGKLTIRRPGIWAPSNSPKGSANAKGKSVETAGRHLTLVPDATSCPRTSPGSTAPLLGAISSPCTSWRTIKPATYRKKLRGYHFACTAIGGFS
ncbi:hypothetical protein C7999DRAFT_18520 [Corynascus novoguineensis]|uniref:F-box domain-containing protein n=1 Tax=Corynascus novoguineensis TaxID=1126955 RepID=A0AAN7CJ51_9PEZI|nr:hypothetical protein C7999DRAFT_18520 [Corynascus novoguineensis]